MFVMLSLSVSSPGKLKSLLDRGRNQTRDLWFASPILQQTELRERGGMNILPCKRFAQVTWPPEIESMCFAF